MGAAKSAAAPGAKWPRYATASTKLSCDAYDDLASDAIVRQYTTGR